MQDLLESLHNAPELLLYPLLYIVIFTLVCANFGVSIFVAFILCPKANFPVGHTCMYFVVSVGLRFKLRWVKCIFHNGMVRWLCTSTLDPDAGQAEKHGTF